MDKMPVSKVRDLYKTCIAETLMLRKRATAGGVTPPLRFRFAFCTYFLYEPAEKMELFHG